METAPLDSRLDESQSIAIHAVLDGGGESGDVLLPAIEQWMGDLAPGQVLEVLSRRAEAVADVPIWCMNAGQRLLRMIWDGHEALFWIEKQEAAAEIG